MKSDILSFENIEQSKRALTNKTVKALSLYYCDTKLTATYGEIG